MIPNLSVRNSTLPPLASRTARPTSLVTVPDFGFGIRPRGARILPQPDVSFNGGVEFGDRGVTDNLTGDLGLEAAVPVAPDSSLHLLGRFDVLLAALLRHYSTTSRPIERAVPSIIFMAASVSYALRSLLFASTIWRTCDRVIRPTFSRFGFAEPFSTPAARLSSCTAGGVLRTNEKLRSSKIVISAGTTSPAC